MSNNEPIVEDLNEDSEYIQTIDLELEDGTIEECEVLDILEVDGKSYVALLPLEGNEYYVYECRFPDDENIEILNVEDEDEHAKVLAVFEEYFNEGSDDDFEDEYEDAENDGDDEEEYDGEEED